MKLNLKLSESLWLRLILYVGAVMSILVFIFLTQLHFDSENIYDLIIMGSVVSVLYLALFWKGKWFKAMEKQGYNPVSSVLFAMVLVSMGMVPCVWYMSNFGSDAGHGFLEDLSMLALVNTFFGAVAIEARNYEDKKWNIEKSWFPYIIILFIWLACVFGFIGIKYWCKWLMLYSGDNYLVAFVLLCSMSVLPISVGLLLMYFSGVADD